MAGDSRQVGERARALFESGFSCAESVVLAVAKESGIESPLVPKIATGFCSGLSRTNSTCGAVSGAVLALSMLFGRSSKDDPAEPTYERVQRFLAGFEQEHGSLTCEGLTGYDLSTDAGREKFRSEGLRARCADLVASAAAMVAELAEAQI